MTNDASASTGSALLLQSTWCSMQYILSLSKDQVMCQPHTQIPLLWKEILALRQKSLYVKASVNLLNGMPRIIHASLLYLTARLCRFHQAKRLKDCSTDFTDIFLFSLHPSPVTIHHNNDCHLTKPKIICVICDICVTLKNMFICVPLKIFLKFLWEKFAHIRNSSYLCPL